MRNLIKSPEGMAKLRERQLANKGARPGIRHARDFRPSKPAGERDARREPKVVAAATAKYRDEILVRGRRLQRAYV